MTLTCSECGNEVYCYLDGTVDCPECGHTELFQSLDKVDADEYETDIVELVRESDYQEIHAEYARCLDLYYKGTTGFPDQQTFDRFRATKHALLVALSGWVLRLSKKEQQRRKKAADIADRTRKMR